MDVLQSPKDHLEDEQLPNISKPRRWTLFDHRSTSAAAGDDTHGEKMLSNEAIVMTPVLECGKSLELASETLKNNEEIVIATVHSSNGMAQR